MTSTAVRVTAFGAGLALAFGAAFAVGALATPYSRGADPASHHEAAGMPRSAGTGSASGLAVSSDGYTLVPTSTTFARGAAVPFSFVVIGPDGRPVEDYTSTHTKDLHLVVVRRDLSGFQHVHPTRSADGTWSVPLDLAAGGTYRAFADFRPVDRTDSITLGVDLQVRGAFVPVDLPAPTQRASVDGYDVTLSGTPTTAGESSLTFTVSRNGRPVDSLAPYLGAFGHLVSLRAGDLAYLHTHPSAEAAAGETGGPEIGFMTTFATPGAHRLFLDFSAGGRVHTAEFTVVAGNGTAADVPAVPTGTRAPHSTDQTHTH